MAEILDQTNSEHRAVKRRHEEEMKPWRNWNKLEAQVGLQYVFDC